MSLLNLVENAPTTEITIPKFHDENENDTKSTDTKSTNAQKNFKLNTFALDSCAISILDAMNDSSDKIRIFEIYQVPAHEVELDLKSGRKKITAKCPTMTALFYLASQHGLQCSTISKGKDLVLVSICKPTEINKDPAFEGITNFKLECISK